MSEHHEVVIVKRRHGGDHDGHHGGAWKIAFADFMTAMMAFFLVLWIVNSTSKETRSSIARYFNPIRLSDTTPARKGLQDPREEDFEASENQDKKPKKEGTTPKSGGAAPTIGAPGSSPTAGGAAPAASAAESPDRPSDGLGNTTVKPNLPKEALEDPFKLLRPKVEQNGYVEQNVPAAKQAPSPAVDAPRREVTDNGSTSDKGTPNNPQPSTAAGDKSLAELKQLQAIGEKVMEQGALREGTRVVSVTQVPEGTLISLMDNNSVPMFSTGSAKLTTEAATALGNIGKLISGVPNSVIIAGYTDSSGFRQGAGDNFILSAMRAQSAMNALVQAGVQRNRIERIEGHADRQPRVMNGPDNSKNRRIDILLRRSDG